jgi:hypothetical protein
MLRKVCLIVAIVGAIGVGVLNFTMVKDKITTIQDQREKEKTAKEAAQKDARDTHQALNKTTAELKSTQETLKSTTEERDRAVAEAASEKKRADTVTADRDKIRKERDDAQSELASYKATDLNPQQIIAINKSYKGLQAENQFLARRVQERGQKIQKLETELAIYKNPEYIVPLPIDLKGKVLVTDPKWNFVVLDIGQDQKVKEQGELLVNRNGKLVAKVRVRSVQKARSIANVMPGWQLGDIMEGDQVIPAHPEVMETESDDQAAAGAAGLKVSAR